MKKTIYILIVLMTVFSSNVLFAQSLDDVLKNHFEAIGQEKLSKVNSYLATVKINQMGMELPMKMILVRPNKFHMEVEMQGQKMIQAYDGESGWMIAPWVSPEPQDLAGQELKQAMEQADIDGELYNYAEKGSTVELLGKEDMDGSEVFNIKLTTKDGDVKNYYIDVETYIILKQKGKISAQGQMIDVETVMGDYQDIEGVIMPMSIASKTPMGTMNITIEEVKFNVEVDESIFERPSN